MRYVKTKMPRFHVGAMPEIVFRFVVWVEQREPHRLCHEFDGFRYRSTLRAGCSNSPIGSLNGAIKSLKFEVKP